MTLNAANANLSAATVSVPRQTLCAHCVMTTIITTGTGTTGCRRVFVRE